MKRRPTSAPTPFHHPKANPVQRQRQWRQRPPQRLDFRRQSSRSERGQSTVEYALILVAVTVMAGVVIAYLAGDGGGTITGLFGAAFDRMRSLVGG